MPDRLRRSSVMSICTQTVRPRSGRWSVPIRFAEGTGHGDRQVPDRRPGPAPPVQPGRTGCLRATSSAWQVPHPLRSPPATGFYPVVGDAGVPDQRRVMPVSLRTSGLFTGR